MRATIVLLPLIAGCTSGSGFPGASIDPDDEVIEVALDGSACGGDTGGTRQWMQVEGAELERDDALLVRIRHAACPGAGFAACAEKEIIATKPGTWEVILDAHAPEGQTGCGAERVEVLRVTLAGDVVPSAGLARISRAHEQPSSSAEERTLEDRRREPRRWAIDVEVAD